MRRVIWSDQALADLETISLYHAESSPHAAARFFTQLKEAGDSLALFAERGRPSSRGTRELTSVKPYIVRYWVAEDRVYIVTVRHAARRPEP
ncbi:type II toxin-antitoxin system RelE/ParE family toxin [Brevundimonas sp.]|uniref:type II toxin-antitoxin system RelE/ParE family toxin n=1 Tax=Brevundimonas sp. TaxID=1871086 RepID=UPI003F708F5C